MAIRSIFIACVCFAALTLSVNGVNLKARYVAYNEDGEPEHVHVDLSKRCPKKGCFNKGRLTSDCSCKCRGFWHGESCESCGLVQSDCRHNSVLDQESCRCVSCPAPWGGSLCNTCSIQTSAGQPVDSETCRVKDCPEPWGGMDCKTCLRDSSFCGEGSILNKETCTCDRCPEKFSARIVVAQKRAVLKAKVEEKIAELKREKMEEEKQNAPIKKAEGKTDWLSWADAFGFLDITSGKRSASSKKIVDSFCGKCPVKKCANEGTVDIEKCACIDCADNWGGLRCETCLLKDSDCQHGAVLDKSTCSCSIACPFPWGGPLCSECKRDSSSCFHSGNFDEDTCRCKECDAPWTGPLCSTCGILGKHCKNGGVPCKNSCRCIHCNRPWRGQFCNICGLSNDDCENGGTVDTNSCTCTCKMPWGGKTCATCVLPKETCSEGTVLNENMCACVPHPKGTAKLAMEKAEKAKKELAKAMKVDGGKMQQVKKFLETRRSAADEQASFLEFVETEKELPRRPKVGKIVSCHFTGVPDTMSSFVGSGLYYGRSRGGYYQHLFVAQECTNGKLPDPREGDWVSSLGASHACGEPEQWSIISPNEEDGPGIMFSNRKPCKKNGAMSVTVHFFLPDQKKYKTDYHRCVWQGTPERMVLPNPAKGGSNAGFSKIMALPAWWTSTPEDRIAAREDPGKMDEDSGGILKKFKLSSDPRGWSEHSNADFPGSITASSPGYHRHVFSEQDCSNGLPPTNRKCFVSMRWGESCGGDRDWRALHKFNGVQDDVAAGVEWYTSQECDSARVAVDYFCPKKNKDFNPENEVITCKYEGEGAVTNCGATERHANDPMSGYCRHHTFKAKECGGTLPAKDAYANHCIVSMREFVQCGEGQDISMATTKGGGGEVSWYTAGWSKIRAGDGGNCSSARIVVDYMCPGECNRKCVNGELDANTCNCKCADGWSGRECQHCGTEQKDCLHGSTLDALKCKCIAPAKSFWDGSFADKCTLKAVDCKNGGVLDQKSCKCIECNDGFKGKLCQQCNRVQEQCKQGALLDTTSCKCSIDCPTGGIFCEQCPLGTNGKACSGYGSCKNGKCLCMGSYSGKSCSEKQNVHKCVARSNSVTPFPRTKQGSVTPMKSGEYRLFEILRKEVFDELTSIHGYYKKIGGEMILVAVYITKANNFHTGEPLKEDTFRFVANEGSYGIDVTEGCTSTLKRAASWVAGPNGALKAKPQGKSGWAVVSINGVFELNIDSYVCGYGTCLTAEINYKDGVKMHNFMGMCGSKSSGYIEQKNLHQISCAGQPKEISLRFQAIRSALLRGQKKTVNLGAAHRFAELRNRMKSDWGSVDWDEPTTPTFESSLSPVEAPLTSFQLIPSDCKSATVSSTEQECKIHLPESFPAGFLRSDPALAPFTVCAENVCNNGDPEMAHKMAKLETLKAKRNRQKTLEQETIQKKIDAEVQAASKIAAAAQMADLNDNEKC